MASYSTNEFRGGLKIILDGEPFTIVENEFVKPGKGQAFNRVRVRNLKTGRVIERTFRSGESVEAADIFETDVQYLYNDGDFWHFMNPESYEQYPVAKEAMGEGIKWLKDGDICLIMLYNGEPLSVTPQISPSSKSSTPTRDCAAIRPAAAASRRPWKPAPWFGCPCSWTTVN